MEAHPDWFAATLADEILQHPRREQGVRRELDQLIEPLLEQKDFAGALGQIRLFKQREQMRIAARDLARLCGTDPGFTGGTGTNYRVRAIQPFDLFPQTAHLETVVLLEAAKKSRDSMHGQLMALCGQQVPGDTYRNLRIQPSYSGETFKHIFVPIWLLTYTFGAKTFQVVANGYTGVLAGQYPKSPWKIAFVVLMVLIVLGILIASQN